MSNNFKDLGNGMVSLHPEKSIEINIGNYPELKELPLTIKSDDKHFTWDGQAQGTVITGKSKPIVMGIGCEMPEAGTTEYAERLALLGRIKFDIVMPKRMFNAKKAQALVTKTFKSPAMKAKSVEQVTAIAEYVFDAKAKDEMVKAGTANVNGTGNAVVVEKPNMF
jgi:hypothetical protein